MEEMAQEKKQKTKKKSGKISTIIFVLIFLVGLSLLLYPTVSNYWNSFHQSRAIASYTEQIANLDTSERDRIMAAAVEYNAALAGQETDFSLSDEQIADYYEQLKLEGTDVMGYIDIPAIDCYLPIYHGTSEGVLQVAVGHLDWTSLPIGGESSHSVLSGHRGLPSAKLFTDLDRMVVGDVFMISVLDEVFTYEVDQILIVEPSQVNNLTIEEGKDYCTLVTCTPYGINTHRLLVRGHRIANLENSETVHITADAVHIEPLIVAPILAIPMLLILLIILLFGGRKNKKKTRGDTNDANES